MQFTIISHKSRLVKYFSKNILQNFAYFLILIKIDKKKQETPRCPHICAKVPEHSHTFFNISTEILFTNSKKYGILL